MGNRTGGYIIMPGSSQREPLGDSAHAHPDVDLSRRSTESAPHADSEIVLARLGRCRAMLEEREHALLALQRSTSGLDHQLRSLHASRASREAYIQSLLGEL